MADIIKLPRRRSYICDTVKLISITRVFLDLHAMTLSTDDRSFMLAMAARQRSGRGLSREQEKRLRSMGGQAA